MFYIYCYVNKINSKKYVGQTNWIARRKSEHRSSAFNPNSKDYNLLFHQKLREYGEDNFDFIILESIDTDNVTIVDEKEKYWIHTMNSYVKNGQGYNLTEGGQDAGRHSELTTERLAKAFDAIINSNRTFKEIMQEQKISGKVLVAINHGIYYKQPGYSYPLRKGKMTDDIKQSIAFLLTTSNLTRQQIADQLGVSLSSVKRIKSGEIKVEGYNEYPLRKPVSTIKG